MAATFSVSEIQLRKCPSTLKQWALIWWNYHFWLDLSHIRSYYHEIQDLIEK